MNADPLVRQTADGKTHYAYYSVVSFMGYEYGVHATNPTICPATGDGHEWHVVSASAETVVTERCDLCGLVRRWAP